VVVHQTLNLVQARRLLDAWEWDWRKSFHGSRLCVSWLDWLPWWLAGLWASGFLYWLGTFFVDSFNCFGVVLFLIAVNTCVVGRTGGGRVCWTIRSPKGSICLILSSEVADGVTKSLWTFGDFAWSWSLLIVLRHVRDSKWSIVISWKVRFARQICAIWMAIDDVSKMMSLMWALHWSHTMCVRPMQCLRKRKGSITCNAMISVAIVIDCWQDRCSNFMSFALNYFVVGFCRSA
jgi:hypothetical protein